MKSLSEKYKENKEVYEKKFYDIRDNFGGKLVAIINKEVKTLDDKVRKELIENKELGGQAYLVYIPPKNDIYALNRL